MILFSNIVNLLICKYLYIPKFGNVSRIGNFKNFISLDEEKRVKIISTIYSGIELEDFGFESKRSNHFAN